MSYMNISYNHSHSHLQSHIRCLIEEVKSPLPLHVPGMYVVLATAAPPPPHPLFRPSVTLCFYNNHKAFEVSINFPFVHAICFSFLIGLSLNQETDFLMEDIQVKLVG